MDTRGMVNIRPVELGEEHDVSNGDLFTQQLEINVVTGADIRETRKDIRCGTWAPRTLGALATPQH